MVQTRSSSKSLREKEREGKRKYMSNIESRQRRNKCISQYRTKLKAEQKKNEKRKNYLEKKNEEAELAFQVCVSNFFIMNHVSKIIIFYCQVLSNAQELLQSLPHHSPLRRPLLSILSKNIDTQVYIFVNDIVNLKDIIYAFCWNRKLQHCLDFQKEQLNKQKKMEVNFYSQ